MAVLDRDFLYDYHTSFFKEQWSQGKLDKIIRAIGQYAASYKIEAIVFIHGELHYVTAEIRQLLTAIKDYFENHDIAVHRYQFSDLRSFYGESRAKRRTLMQTLADRFPELRLAHRKELVNHKKYYTKLFEAIAGALIHTEHCLS